MEEPPRYTGRRLSVGAVAWEGRTDMPRYLWGPGGQRWEVIYHQPFQMWEIVESATCPFSLQYCERCGLTAEICRVCGGRAEPAVFLRNPETGSVLFDTGPICLSCVCGDRTWYTKVSISIPRSLLGEPNPPDRRTDGVEPNADRNDTTRTKLARLPN